MVGKIEVLSENDYQEKLMSLDVANSIAQRGRKEFLRLNCIVCHTGKSDAQAPSLEELFAARKKVLAMHPDGKYVSEEITVDEGYILESILDPRAKIAEPWRPVMPGHFAENTTPEERTALIQFIKSLKRGQTPDRNERTPSPVGAPNTTPKQTTSPSPEKKP